MYFLNEERFLLLYETFFIVHITSSNYLCNKFLLHTKHMLVN